MKDTINYPDFDKLDLRVGEVLSASVPQWSEKLIELKVNFGSGIGEKTIFSGVKQWYLPENFINKKFIFIINLAERKMGESVSQGMMLMVDPSTELGATAAEKPIPIELDNNSKVGDIVR